MFTKQVNFLLILNKNEYYFLFEIGLQSII